MGATRFCAFAALAVGFVLAAENTHGQNAVFTRQIPSVVQLPSFQFFSYSGSVMVPDSGAAYLGGVNRSATGLNRRGRGLSRGRGFGFAQSSSQASVHATIIDQDAMDRQLRGESNAKGKSTKSKTIEPDEEGKALVRFARKQYRQGNKAAAFDTYRLAISVLNGRLKELAKVEFRRVFGTAADQSLRMADARR